MTDIQAHVYISGRVQGVFFRASTRDKARDLDLKGWVRNLPDGRVEAVFEGPEERVREMIRWCHKGSAYSSVTDVEFDIREASGEFDDFEIRY